MASLIDAGMDTEDAAAQISAFDNLSDEQFEVFATMVKKYKDGGKVKAEEDSEAGMHGDMKKKDEKKEDEAKAEEVEDTEAAAEEVEAEVVEASEEVLDTAEASEEDITLTLASEDVEEEAIASLRSNLQDWVSQKVLKK